MRTAYLSFLLLLLLPAGLFAQPAAEKAIHRVLTDQEAAWNRGSLDQFMEGYWKNDSLMFIGKSGVTYGYANTLNNYKKGYSNADEMGQLHFTLLKVQKLSRRYYFVVGKWELTRTVGDVGGHYNLLFRKVKGKWVIVADHSS